MPVPGAAVLMTRGACACYADLAHASLGVGVQTLPLRELENDGSYWGFAPAPSYRRMPRIHNSRWMCKKRAYIFKASRERILCFPGYVPAIAICFNHGAALSARLIHAASSVSMALLGALVEHVRCLRVAVCLGGCAALDHAHAACLHAVFQGLLMTLRAAFPSVVWI